MPPAKRWIVKRNEMVEFFQTNHRNSARHRIEEHDILNWLKANRKKMNAEGLKAERVELFQKLLDLSEQYKRKNQYQ